MGFKLLSSPLQGFTDYRFRNAFHEIFGGIDIYYAPYIKFFNKLEIKNSYQRDLLPENNKVPELIPQVMTNSAEEFLFAANYVESLGYEELNWNLGCPYPMVTKRGMGAGLIHNAELIDSILDEVHSKSNITVSMKMRLGHESPTEILDVFPVLAKYPIKNIAIHARLGKQLYKGTVDLDSFQTALESSSQPIYYNGDITTVERFKEMQKLFPSVSHFMIGRGLIADPFLPKMIQTNSNTYPENRVELLGEFHDVLFNQYDEALSGSSHLISKMHNFWEYYSKAFENPQKTFKKIKKAKNIIKYKIAVREILNAEA
jgi:tRNA-dihydrouridine synthase